MVRNIEVAELLYEIADLLDMQDIEFKPRAYRRAARQIETMSEDIEKVTLEDVPGVGKGIAKKITEYLQTGRSSYLQKLKKEIPVDVEGITAIEGVGPKTVKLLYDKLGIATVSDLKKAVMAGKLRSIPGLGEKSEKNILDSIKLRSTGRISLGIALPIALELESRLKKHVTSITVAGSLRRRKETIGDLDILVTSNRPIMEIFTALPAVKKVLAKGPTRSSVILDSGLHVDLRLVKEGQWGSALMYFTGSKDHNVQLRRAAISKGMKLSEYGLFKGKKTVASKTEKEVYAKLGMDYVEPELREATGEVEAAQKHQLPEIISKVKGDLQMHTTWSDGSASVSDMADAAKKLGYEYILITDHVGKLKIANAVDSRRFLRYIADIEKANRQVTGITILKGAEVDINKQGKLDIPKSMLSELDIVLGGIHSGFKQDMTARILSGMEHVDILAHPTGRMINRRAGYDFDIQKIFDKAKETNTVLEINASPMRLDIDSSMARRAKEFTKLSIGTDAHSPDQLAYMSLGVSVARRAWCAAEDVINCWPLKKLLSHFQ